MILYLPGHRKKNIICPVVNSLSPLILQPASWHEQCMLASDQQKEKKKNGLLFSANSKITVGSKRAVSVTLQLN